VLLKNYLVFKIYKSFFMRRIHMKRVNQ